MGFSGVFGSVIMFLAVISISLVFFTAFNQMADNTSNSIKIQGDAIANTMKTDLFFESISYNSSEITLYVKNTGKTKLELDKIHFYVDGIFIPITDRTVLIESTTDISNPGIFDPAEILVVQINKNLNSGNHKIALTSQYSFKIEDIFSVA